MGEVALNVDFLVAGDKGESPVRLRKVTTKNGQDITQRFTNWCAAQSIPFDTAGTLGKAAGEFAKAHDSLLA